MEVYTYRDRLFPSSRKCIRRGSNVPETIEGLPGHLAHITTAGIWRVQQKDRLRERCRSVYGYLQQHLAKFEHQ